MALKVSNTGSADLNVISISSTDRAFTVSPATLTVSPGGSKDVTVTFAPTAETPKVVTLTLSHNAPDGSSQVIMTAKGVGPTSHPVLSLQSLEFGSAQMGEQKSRALTVSNTGSALLQVTAVSFDDPDFTASMASFTVPVGGTPQILVVRFAPSARGPKTATRAGAGCT